MLGRDVQHAGGCIACGAQRAIDEAVISSSNQNHGSGQEDCLGVCLQ